MATIYFLKQLAGNRIPDRSGVPIPFERCSESRGIIAVDDKKKAELVADLNQYVEQRKGGVSVIDEATYDDLKKNFPHTPRPPVAAPRLFDPAMDPFSQRGSAAPVAAVGDAGLAGVSVSVAPVGVPGASGLPSRPVSKGRQVRTGRAPAAPVSDTPSQPAVEAPAKAETSSGE